MANTISNSTQIRYTIVYNTPMNSLSPITLSFDASGEDPAVPTEAQLIAIAQAFEGADEVHLWSLSKEVVQTEYLQVDLTATTPNFDPPTE